MTKRHRILNTLLAVGLMCKDFTQKYQVKNLTMTNLHFSEKETIYKETFTHVNNKSEFSVQKN